jgi:hypothetical protein
MNWCQQRTVPSYLLLLWVFVVVQYHITNLGFAEGSDQVFKGSEFQLWGITAGKTSFKHWYLTCETLVSVSLQLLLGISDTASNMIYYFYMVRFRVYATIQIYNVNTSIHQNNTAHIIQKLNGPFLILESTQYYHKYNLSVSKNTVYHCFKDNIGIQLLYHSHFIQHGKHGASNDLLLLYIFSSKISWARHSKKSPWYLHNLHKVAKVKRSHSYVVSLIL